MTQPPLVRRHGGGGGGGGGAEVAVEIAESVSTASAMEERPELSKVELRFISPESGGTQRSALSDSELQQRLLRFIEIHQKKKKKWRLT